MTTPISPLPTTPHVLILPEGVRRAITDHALREYPGECCGLLVGRDVGGARVVSRAVASKNVTPERVRDRYVVDPQVQLQAERQAAAEGQEVLGVYHSHPDHPARPSMTDLQRAWPVYSYVIISVTGGVPAGLASFRLTEGAFVEETIREATA